MQITFRLSKVKLSCVWRVLLLFTYYQPSYAYDCHYYCMVDLSSVLPPSDCYCALYGRSARSATRWLVQVRSEWWRRSSGTGPCGIPHASCAACVRSSWWTSRTVFMMTCCTVRDTMPSSWSHAVQPAMRWVRTLQTLAPVNRRLVAGFDVCVLVGRVDDRWFLFRLKSWSALTFWNLQVTWCTNRFNHLKPTGHVMHSLTL